MIKKSELKKIIKEEFSSEFGYPLGSIEELDDNATYSLYIPKMGKYFHKYKFSGIYKDHRELKYIFNPEKEWQWNDPHIEYTVGELTDAINNKEIFIR